MVKVDVKDKKLIEVALAEGERLGVDYLDLRLIRKKYERIHLKNDFLSGYVNNKEIGMGVRVIVDGYWGFAGNPDMTEDKVKKAVQRAVELARASKIAGGERVDLSPVEVIQDEWQTKFLINPFEVPLEEKLDILYEATSEMKKVPQVLLREGYMSFWEEEKIFASSEGSIIKQFFIHSGGGISATAISESGEVQTRTFPSSFRGDFAQRGFEFVKALPLKEKALDIAKEAALLLQAPLCPEGKMDVILGESQLALQVHESCGHPVELDRVFGMEANYAGTSFMTPKLRGKLKYGSEIVNIVADATVEDGLGSFGYDDEGVKAQKTPIIKDGVFVGYLMSRETAPKLGLKSNGAMRAMDWNNIPLIRMTNINLLPGKDDLGDIISSTEKGILLKNNRSWSIDDKRINFQFGCEIGWLIEKGRIKGIVKNPTYSGTTVEFWNSCDAIAHGKYYKMWGTPNCGKGQPGQIMRVGHGVSYARFKNVKVGVGNVRKR